jgi:hypothetical protein
MMSPTTQSTPATVASSTPQRAPAWVRVARRVVERRRALDLTVEDAAARSGVDVATWHRIEQAAQPGYRAHRLAGVCRALGWTPDSINRIVSGGEPEPAGAARHHSRLTRLVLRPVSTRNPDDGRFEVCPARLAIASGFAIEAFAVIVFFRL